MAIAYSNGDIDLPYIAYALHDSEHPDHVTRDNHTRNVLRTPANNKIRLDDNRGQEHIKVSTEYGGKSQLNLGHLLTFSLASAGLVALHATHAALRGLELELVSAEPVFAGERLELQIRLDDRHPARRPWRFGRHGILLRWREPAGTETGTDAAAPRSTGVPEGGSVTVRLERPTPRRGAQTLPPLEIESRFPLGLFRAWAVWRIAREPLVLAATLAYEYSDGRNGNDVDEGDLPESAEPTRKETLQ